jgi:signal transduction histidine kinase
MTGTASRPERPATGAYRPRPTPRPASRPAPPTRTAAAAAVGTYTSSGWGKAPLDDERQGRERLAVVDERSRIARELQAVVARSVSAMIVQSQAAQRLLDLDPSTAEEAMTEIERTGREALTEMRRLLGVLRDTERDADLRPQPGVGQLHTLVEHSRAAGRDVELRVEGAPRPLPPSVDLGVYRIIEEALTGTADTASPAAPVAVVLRFTDTHVALNLTISWPAPISWPTATMRERIALCNGEVNINTASDATDQLRVRLPGTLTGALATG